MTHPQGSLAGSILGTRVARVEDPRLIRGRARYTAEVDDPRLAGATRAVFVRSPMAHARIGSIDTAAAVAAPGVVAVLTAADLDLPEPIAEFEIGITEPYLARDAARYVGQAVALVIAEDEAAALDAAELVVVDYEPLPAVVSVEEAARDEVLLFPEVGTNIAARTGQVSGDDFFAGCEIVITGTIINNRVAPAPMEGRAAAAVWAPDPASIGDATGWGGVMRLTMWLPNQGAQEAKRELSAALGTEAVHVITPDVGGAFGAKFGAEPDHIAIAAAARIVGRPVKWAETRSENLIAMAHGRAQRQQVTIGGTRAGKMIAYRLEVDQDAGAYPRLAFYCVQGTARMAPGVYGFQRCEVATRTIMTTTTPVGAFRGAGRPEATAAVERAVDLFAAEIGMDPAEVRRRNVLPPFDTPFSSLTGAVYDSGDYAAALEAVLAAGSYDELRAEQAARRERGDELLLGLGLSVYVEITGGGRESATVELRPDGGATVLTGVSPHGQGHATAFAMIVADLLGVPVDRVDLVWGDTEQVPRGGGTGGSRSLQLGGSAAYGATVAVGDLARARAAELWEIDVADVLIDRGRAGVAVAGVPGQFVSFAELAAKDGLRASELFKADGATFPFGAHLAVVTVDRPTGAVRLERLIAVDDAGRVLNPLLAEGQRHGGLAQGVSQALYEHAVFDADGNPTAASFVDYHLPSAADLPSFELLAAETPTPFNMLGAKGLGEAATIGATPAVQNAVIDAVAHLGVRHIDMPMTPARVWAAIRAAG